MAVCLKLYVITKGEYDSSDYHICAATVSKEKAEIIKKLFSDKYNYDDCRIEEFEDGDGEDDIRIMWVYYTHNDEVRLIPEIFQHNYQEGISANEESGYTDKVFTFAKDADQAMARAKDMITKYKNRMKI